MLPRPDTPEPPRVEIDPLRYRRVRRFFARVFLHALWWDVLLALPGLRRLRTPPLPRWQRLAARYRVLAVEMGGVLIKLGQFLSSRVDLLPLGVIRELAGLQDEVPPEPVAAIRRQIEDDLGRPLEELFADFEAHPLGAASLAQAHRARLTSGEPVVVKALRPGIDVLVETDLAAVRVALAWLRLWRPVRRRVDLERLGDEFAATTRRELDLRLEADNAERLRHAFAGATGAGATGAGEPEVGFPEIHRALSARRTLTMEDVSFIKIGDHAALEAAGIDRGEVARAVYRAYMHQIFTHYFVHADPHPGNLFVRPLDAGGQGAAAATPSGRAFRLYFVDFGMVAEVPARLRRALRSYAIGLATRDPARVVAAYAEAGVLLPGADLERLEEAHAAIFQRFWGVELGRLRSRALAEAPGLIREYRDLIYEAPFQFPVELLFVGRAVGLLAGLATSLDPDFDPWVEIEPFARRLARRELGDAFGLDAALEAAGLLVGLPRRLDAALERLERGEVVAEVRLSRQARRDLGAIDAGLRRLSWSVAAAALFLAGSGIYLLRGTDGLGVTLIGLGTAAFLWGLVRGR